MRTKIFSRAVGRAIFIAAIAAIGESTSFSQEDADDLTSLSLESLFNVRVSSVYRRMEELRKTAAAAFVITQEDIRRSGATDVADLLRMAPGIDVSQLTGNAWAVSVRGFNNLYANKLLVQVDGRTVYDPTFSGVFWDRQNVILEDIERIEVIRGPGATMWGANAVNGVISITTKAAERTQGGLLVADAGARRPAEGSFRYGGALSSNAFFRISGRQTTRSTGEADSLADARDSWNMTDATFRVDWEPSLLDSFVFEAGGYRGVTASPLAGFGSNGLVGKNGGHALARWTRSLSPESDLTVQLYYNNSRIDGPGGNRVDLLDFDAQHSFRIGARNDVTWGMGHRHIRDAVFNTASFTILPQEKSTSLSNAFVQDELTLVEDRLYFTAGSKFEHSSFTGYNVQPSARLLWLPDERQSVWVSAARAVRTANRTERGLSIDFAAPQTGPLPVIASVRGQEDTLNEELTAWEAGYRIQPVGNVWIDLAAFYNVYDRLSTTDETAPVFKMQPAPHIAVTSLFGNGMKGETYGAEVTGHYRVNNTLLLKANYSLLRMDLHPYPGTTEEESRIPEGQSPRHQLYAAALLTLPRAFEVSAHTYVVGSLPRFDVPSYTRLDLNVTWRRFERVELSAAGQNLLGSHTEFGGQAQVYPVQRAVFGKIAWRF